MSEYVVKLSDKGTIAVDDTILVKDAQSAAGSRILEGFKPRHKRIGNKGAEPRLGNLEHEEYNGGKSVSMKDKIRATLASSPIRVNFFVSVFIGYSTILIISLCGRQAIVSPTLLIAAEFTHT